MTITIIIPYLYRLNILILVQFTITFSDIYDGGLMWTAFQNYKNSIEELRGGADVAALIVQKFQYCGLGITGSWR